MSQEAVSTIKRKIENLARELAQNEEIGLDESTLLRIFEAKTDKFILNNSNVNRFTFDEHFSKNDLNRSLNESSGNFNHLMSRQNKILQ